MSSKAATVVFRTADARTGGDRGSMAGRGGGDRARVYRSVPERVYVTGLWIALCGILMFFLALISAYVVREGLSQDDWLVLSIPPIVWLNTGILIVSSFTLKRSRDLQAQNDEAGFLQWWFATAVLGVIFLVGQLSAWRDLAQAGLYLRTDPNTGFFYVFTASHGLHLLGGVGALILIGVRPPQFLRCDLATRIVGVYWHFLCGLWLLLLLFFLLNNRS
jgi:cytochrome c oxidase subunit III